MQILCALLWGYTIVLVGRIILSWVTMAWSPPPALDPVVRVIFDLTEPVMSLFRRYIPPVGGFDFSPIIIFLLLGLARGYVCG